MRDRVVHVSQQESRRRLAELAEDNGLSYPWLTRMAHTEGHNWVADWLDAHRFEQVAEALRSAVFLHGWEPLHRPDQNR